MLAVSLDGRLAPPEGGAAQIGGRGDRRVLEEALAWADGALIGAETLRRHGTTCLIHDRDLLQQRQQRAQPPQPHALVVSRSGLLPARLPFFHQPLQRWLLLASASESGSGAAAAVPDPPAAGPVSALEPSELEPSELEHRESSGGFDRLLPLPDWERGLRALAAAGLQRLVVLGGAALAGSLLAEDRLDALQLTVAPLLLGGPHTWLAPQGALPADLRRGWTLQEQRLLEGGEVLLRYRRCRQPS